MCIENTIAIAMEDLLPEDRLQLRQHSATLGMDEDDFVTFITKQALDRVGFPVAAHKGTKRPPAMLRLACLDGEVCE